MPTNFSGPLRSSNRETDGQIFIPASAADIFTGTWTKTRTAAGDINMLKTAGAETSITAFNLNRFLNRVGTDPSLADGFPLTDASGAARIRGIRLTAVDVLWKNTTADLTSATLDLHQTTYAGQTAANPVVSSTVGGTLSGASLTVTASANTRLERVTLGTPYVLGANTSRVEDFCEITWVCAGTSVLTVYGIILVVDYNLM